MIDKEEIWIITKDRYTPLSHDGCIYYSEEEAIRKYIRSLCHREADPDDMNIEECWKYEKERNGINAIKAILIREEDREMDERDQIIREQEVMIKGLREIIEEKTIFCTLCRRSLIKALRIAKKPIMIGR